MTDVQKVLLEMFIYFDKICNENNLNYYAIGGTCIGAIRHKGFIPWDDDIDLAMPLNDFYKLRDIFKKNKNPNYELIDYLGESTNFKRSLFFKIQNVNTISTRIQDIDKPKRYRGIVIDIMPMTGITKNKLNRKLYMNKLKILYMKNYVINSEYNDFNSKIKRFAWRILYVMFKKENKNFYLEKIEKHIKKYEFSPKNDIFFVWRIILNKKTTKKNIFPFEYFKEYEYRPFETAQIRVPKLYDEYLKMDFGDYMQLPPKEKQVPVHNVGILDTKKSYKYYAEEYIKKNNGEKEKSR